MTRWMLCTATLLLATLLPARVLAQATTVNDSHIGMVHNVLINDNDQTQKWFTYWAVSGRSYCAEVGSGADRTGVANAYLADPQIVIRYTPADAPLNIASNGDTLSEPHSYRGARACFVAGFTGSFEVGVLDSNNGTFTYRMRVVETTLWASWFFIGGDYNSFVLLRNTTGTTVNYTITWRSPAGTVIGTRSGTVAGNAALGINARTVVNNPASTSTARWRSPTMARRRRWWAK